MWIEVCFGIPWRKSITTLYIAIFWSGWVENLQSTLVIELNDNFMLSKDRFSKIKYDMLYIKPKVWLSRARDDDYFLKLGCDGVVSFAFQVVVEGVEKRKEKSKLVKTLTTKTWYLEMIYRMHSKINNRWIEDWQSIDILDWPLRGNLIILVSK